MSDVLIRAVPEEDLESLRTSAKAEGKSLQAYLRTLIHEQAVANHNRAVLARTAKRVAEERSPVTLEDILAAKDYAQQVDE